MISKGGSSNINFNLPGRGIEPSAPPLHPPALYFCNSLETHSDFMNFVSFNYITGRRYFPKNTTLNDRFKL